MTARYNPAHYTVLTDADYSAPRSDRLVEASQLFTRYQKCRLAGNHQKALQCELLLHVLKREATEDEKAAIAVFTDAMTAEQAERAERLGLRSYIA